MTESRLGSTQEWIHIPVSPSTSRERHWERCPTMLAARCYALSYTRQDVFRERQSATTREKEG